MHKEIPKDVVDKDLQDLALRMAVHCVRNTIIENYHASGKLTDDEMKNFNKEVTNKIYSFLQILLSPYYKEERITLFSHKHFPFMFYIPDNWDKPEFDKSFLALLEKIKKNTSKDPSVEE